MGSGSVRQVDGARKARARARERWTRRLGALGVAAFAQATLLWLTAVQQRAVPFPTVEAPATPVWIVRLRAPPAPHQAKPPVVRQPAAVAAAPRPGAGPPSQPTPETSAPPAAGPAAPATGAPATGAPATGAPGAVASALRGSVIGCANAAALGLSDAERAGCRDRLAAGAATAPAWTGIPAAKRGYYDAVLATEADYRKTGGHPPMVVCFGHARLPHALKIGPCQIDPPQGSLDPDVDVPEIESQRDSLPPPR